MKQLICEMCGSNDLIKQEGVFVCQTCGCKYSLEEAKKMMIEGNVDVSGSTVKVDNTAFIENYYKMAESAFESSNLNEAETYCNKIMEIDSDNYKAWLLKGRAAGWQSSLGNLRLEEAVNCFSKAVDNAPEEEKDTVKKEVAKGLNGLSLALVSLACNNYANNATEENANEIKAAVKLVNLYSLDLLVKCGSLTKDITADIATKINESVVAAYQNDICTDYWGIDKHPSEYVWNRYKQRSAAAVDLLKYAIELNEDDDKEDITRHKNIIKILEDVRASTSYTYSSAGWIPEYKNSKEVQLYILNMITECYNEIKKIDPTYVIPEHYNAKLKSETSTAPTASTSTRKSANAYGFYWGD